MFLWFKLLHIFFIISWFAGLFYLPRIFVNLAQLSPQDGREYERLLEMSQRLMRFMQPLAIGSLLFGILTASSVSWWGEPWIHIKLLIGLLLFAYHWLCFFLLKAFADGKNTRSHKWFRVFNEIPVLLMFAALYLVIFKLN
ncbi:MAG: CopD family protein [Neisseria sp.]|nr:CopD family protein [Neisseria sp.]